MKFQERSRRPTDTGLLSQIIKNVQTMRLGLITTQHSGTLLLNLLIYEGKMGMGGDPTHTNPPVSTSAPKQEIKCKSDAIERHRQRRRDVSCSIGISYGTEIIEVDYILL